MCCLLWRFARSEQDSFGTIEIVTCSQRSAQLTHELVGLGQEVYGAGQEVHRGRRVRALPRADAGPPEPLAAFLSELLCMLVRARELCQVTEGLLEVVADELVGAVASVQRTGCELVELRPLRLWEAAIG